jgi:hypothetical protein
VISNHVRPSKYLLNLSNQCCHTRQCHPTRLLAPFFDRPNERETAKIDQPSDRAVRFGCIFSICSSAGTPAARSNSYMPQSLVANHLESPPFPMLRCHLPQTFLPILYPASVTLRVWSPKLVLRVSVRVDTAFRNQKNGKYRHRDCRGENQRTSCNPVVTSVRFSDT